jgi:hypothetical protein
VSFDCLPLKGYDQETFNQLIEEEHSEATPKANRGIVLNATTKERTVYVLLFEFFYNCIYETNVIAENNILVIRRKILITSLL